MLKIALGQMDVEPGRPDLNTRTILKMSAQAREQGAQLAIFPEMAVPGYLLGDTWEQESFLWDCEEYGQQIIAASAGICLLFGNVAMDWDKTGDDGRVRKYNAFFTAQDGRLFGGDNFPYPFRIKTLHPNYREFDDTRYFCSLRKLALELGVRVEDLLRPVRVNVGGERLTLGNILCEDGWGEDYPVKPMAVLNKNGPVDLFVNISSSPYTTGKNNKRNRVFSAQVRALGVPLVYVNHVGMQNNGKTVYVFDGNSAIYNRQGDIVEDCGPLSVMLKVTELDMAEGMASLPAIESADDSGMASIFAALRYGIEQFLASTNITKMVVGVSGGIDSAVSASLFARVLGPGNVLLVNMPSVYNSRTTRGLAARLAENLGCLYAVVPIQQAVDFTVKQLEEAVVADLRRGTEFNLPVTPLMVENIQARDRSGRILAALAAAFGGGFSCNANKSEITVGYCTLYGDQAGLLAPLGDLWKHQVYALAEYMNRHVYCREVIPPEIMKLKPSAELSPDQAVDEGKGDPLVYPYHDYLFRAFMERWNKATPEEILQWYLNGTLEEKLGCEPGLAGRIFPGPREFIEDLERWWKLYSGMGVAKRIQAPPIIAVSRRAYGFDHREAQNGWYFTGRYLRLKAQILNGQER